MFFVFSFFPFSFFSFFPFSFFSLFSSCFSCANVSAHLRFNKLGFRHSLRFFPTSRTRSSTRIVNKSLMSKRQETFTNNDDNHFHRKTWDPNSFIHSKFETRPLEMDFRRIIQGFNSDIDILRSHERKSICIGSSRIVCVYNQCVITILWSIRFVNEMTSGSVSKL